MRFSIISKLSFMKGALVQLDLCMCIFTMLYNITFLNVGNIINIIVTCIAIYVTNFIFFHLLHVILYDVHVHVLCINYKGYCVVSKVIFT